MRLRLVEEYSVTYGTTRYAVERKTRWQWHWHRINSYQQEAEARELFDRFKKARGEFWNNKVIEEWSAPGEEVKT